MSRDRGRRWHPNPLTYNVTFQDFRFLQGCMARRTFARNRADYLLAMLGVVLCAFFLAMAIVVNIAPYRAAQIFGAGIRYPLSAYLILVVLLVAAIVSLMPAVKLRLRTLRMQVSDDGPYLGATRLGIESDGLTIDRSVMGRLPGRRNREGRSHSAHRQRNRTDYSRLRCAKR